MKLLFLFFLLIPFIKVKSQQSFRIQHLPRMFKWNMSGTLDKKINDSLNLHIVNKSPDYEISIIRTDGTIACSCLYRLNSKSDTLQTRRLVQTSKGMEMSDSTMQVKVFIPVNDNCVEQYRRAVSQSQ